MNDTCLLLVDDEAIILMALKMECKKRYKQSEVITALNAEQALQCLAENKDKQHVIISDYQMPGMKGDEFLRKVTQEYPDSILIMLTGQAPDEVLKTLNKELRLRACLRKPWLAKELYAVLDTVMQ